MLGVSLRDEMDRGRVQKSECQNLAPTLDRRQPFSPATLPFSPPPTHTPAAISPALAGLGGLATRVNMAKTGL